MNPSGSFWPTGTVYGCLLNFRRERQQLGDRMAQPPHKAPPQAPVLYVKTANTWSASGAAIIVPAGADSVLVGASVALVMGPRQWQPHADRALPTVAAHVLVNDLELPGGTYFRPAVRTKCVDGFLGLGAHAVTPADAGDPARFVLELRINGDLRQTIRFDDLVRDAATLVRDVDTFMSLHEGDLLMLGCDADRPTAHAGDHIEIAMAGQPAFGVLSHTLAPASTQEAA
ncbi:fumarylacetoacetate hydrolase family protein [Comamonadaceae bacterium G21597-S1]|nr:fumarylacetoacetate hydrolase family protein [Comamonadaceae bacterium G21597-S1]